MNNELRITNNGRKRKNLYSLFIIHYSNSGQSLIEIILAVAIFVIIASSCVMAILGSFSTGRLAEEESKATLLATEGIEATSSIRNSGWTNLANGDHGLTNSGTWSFSGTSNTDPSGKYNRVVAVSDVLRDGNGDIVLSGGTIDSATKKVVSTVTWNFTQARQNSVIMESYLTDWQTGNGVGVGGTSPMVPATCAEYCVTLGYSGGTCRKGASKCIDNNEVMENGGNNLCTIQADGGTCCCAP